MPEKVDVVAIMREIQNKADELYENENHSFRYEMLLHDSQDSHRQTLVSENHNSENLSSKCIDIHPLLELDNEIFVDEVYLRILGRKPDDEGKLNLINQLKSMNKEDVIRSIATSDEAKQKGVFTIGYSSVSLSDLLKEDGERFVRQAYCFILGRDADEFGLKINLYYLRSKALTKEQILISLKDSKEGQCRSVKITDYDSIRKKVFMQNILMRMGFKKGSGSNSSDNSVAVETIVSLEMEIDKLNSKIQLLQHDVESANQAASNSNRMLSLICNKKEKDVDELKERILSLSNQMSEVNKRINKFETNISSDLGAVARQTMLAKWMSIDQKIVMSEKPSDKLTCKICGTSHTRSEYKTLESDCIFNGGHLTRYICPDCGVVFGPSKFVNQGQHGIDEDYRVHYLGFSEGDSSYKEERAFKMLSPDKNKIYLNYGCGKWSKTLQKLRDEGYKVYGYEPYASENGNPYMITQKSELLKMKFDGIFSNDLLEHLINPIDDLKMMSQLLINEDSKMAHCTSCYSYKYEYTRFHVHFFLGDSVKVLAEKADLDIIDCVDDLAENDFYCYLFSPKKGKNNILSSMFVNENARFVDSEAILQKNGIIYGPYYRLWNGKYSFSLVTKGNCENLKYKVTCDKGKITIDEGQLIIGYNKIVFSVADEIKDTELIIENKSCEDSIISDVRMTRENL